MDTLLQDPTGDAINLFEGINQEGLSAVFDVQKDVRGVGEVTFL